ncbi:MAG: phosphoglucomutase (alpha-D-glucose-1,6-bisphosphate-dependent) [Leadbetterella sp.]|nr:phosphoglucomutase (alpha-D-glucose-1,6-bisphosphate-dependent) [Leadbetterella sp.]
MTISPLAGQYAPSSILANIPRLITAYYTNTPDASIQEQRVSFGTSGHRGSSLDTAFNESHILAITQAICLYRKSQNINGPLFMGMDTHALSFPALASALEVLAANGVEVMLSEKDEYTPTPAISHAILTFNRGKKTGLADGIVITPSHNPPSEGGFKYNPPNGGPSAQDVTKWIEQTANAFLENHLSGIQRITYEKALKASTTHRHPYLELYVNDLKNVIDMDLLSQSKIKMGVDPLGGAGVHYWKRIADQYHLDLTVVSEAVDPTFRFMSVDWDGQIRMDPSSSYAMKRLIEIKDRFQIAFACDTDHDRHGIVTKSYGLIPPNHYLSVMIHYLFQHRPLWSPSIQIGKTIVSSSMINRVGENIQRKIYEVPVGFKWFVDGLFDGSLGFGGEESAGASFLRLDGSVWTTDKDGMIPALLAGEMTARLGKDPGEIYQELSEQLGAVYNDRIEASANYEEKKRIASMTSDQIKAKELAGEKITAIQTHAAGNNVAFGGIKVETQQGWFAARPSGTEKIYKIYGESFKSKEHLNRIFEEAKKIIQQALL